MNYVKPCNDGNAIRVAAFALEFPEGIDESIVAELIKVYHENDDLVEALPRKQINHALTLNLESPSNASVKTIDGVTFDRLTSDGKQEWAIVLARNSIVVSCGKYTRWEDVLANVKRYFDIVLRVLDGRAISIVGLEYVDEFIISNHTEDWKGEMLNNKSKYLPSNIFELPDLWHSHHGFIVNGGSSNVNATLNNFNVDYLIEDQAISATHKVMMRIQHRTELKELEACSDDFFDRIALKIFKNNHTLNKDIMRNVLSKEMCVEIQLGD